MSELRTVEISSSSPPRMLQQEWQAAQTWERDWWLNNPQQYAVEISKSDTVAGWMGIRDMPYSAVVDIGCGPFSILQRVKVRMGVAVDPIDYGPLEFGYKTAGITRLVARGEDVVLGDDQLFDEAWIYNCLQHVEDPTLVITRAMAVAKRVRLFEWVNIPPYTGHLHMLTDELLASPFHAADWHCNLRTHGVADADGLNGQFFVGVYTRRSADV